MQVERASKRFVLARVSFGIGECPYDFAKIELFYICSRGLNRVYVISIVHILSRKVSQNSRWSLLHRRGPIKFTK